MGGISFEISKDTITPVLQKLIERMSDLKPVMDQIGSKLVSNTELRFEQEQAPDGSIWPKSLRAQIQEGTTLRDQGHLRDSISYEASSNKVEIGTAKEYAAIHQFGGVIRAKNKPYLVFSIGQKDNGKPDLRKVKSVTMPARPFLGVGPKDETAIRNILTGWLGKATS